jgi:hypothetical protein
MITPLMWLKSYNICPILIPLYLENGKSYLKYVAKLHEEKLLTQSIQRKKHIKIFLPYA